MPAWTEYQPLARTTSTTSKTAEATVSRNRRSLASTLEIALEPRHATRRGLRTWPRMPRANRLAVAEPLREIISLLRDPEMQLADDALPEIMAFATHPTSPAYGPYPTRASFAAHALSERLREQRA
jgi:hypothetical protein